MHPEHEDFREFLSFIENVRRASRRLLERIGMLESGFRMSRKIVDVFSEGIHFVRKIAISDTLGVTNAMVRAQRKDFGEEEGSTSHPRGKQWLTVYRAHKVRKMICASRESFLC